MDNAASDIDIAGRPTQVNVNNMSTDCSNLSLDVYNSHSLFSEIQSVDHVNTDHLSADELFRMMAPITLNLVAMALA